jgi:hypothetical protein
MFISSAFFFGLPGGNSSFGNGKGGNWDSSFLDMPFSMRCDTKQWKKHKKQYWCAGELCM